MLCHIFGAFLVFLFYRVEGENVRLQDGLILPGMFFFLFFFFFLYSCFVTVFEAVSSEHDFL